MIYGWFESLISFACSHSNDILTFTWSLCQLLYLWRGIIVTPDWCAKISSTKISISYHKLNSLWVISTMTLDLSRRESSPNLKAFGFLQASSANHCAISFTFPSSIPSLPPSHLSCSISPLCMAIQLNPKSRPLQTPTDRSDTLFVGELKYSIYCNWLEQALRFISTSWSSRKLPHR